MPTKQERIASYRTGWLEGARGVPEEDRSIVPSPADLEAGYRDGDAAFRAAMTRAAERIDQESPVLSELAKFALARAGVGVG